MTFFYMTTNPYKSSYYTNNKASDTKAFSASQTTNGTAIAPIAAQPGVSTEVAETPDEIDPFAEIIGHEEAEEPVAVFEFVWHCNHGPVFVA